MRTIRDTDRPWRDTEEGWSGRRCACGAKLPCASWGHAEPYQCAACDARDLADEAEGPE